MGADELKILELLDSCLQSEAIRARILPIVERVQSQLLKDRSASMSWEPIPLTIYGESLPSFIRSSWVFILRAGGATGAERHPNSHQRMMSFRGAGDAQTGGEGRWQSNPLISDRDAAIEKKWISIPINVWHQMVVPEGDDWVVASFHTVPTEELIEERPSGVEKGQARQRFYVASGG